MNRFHSGKDTLWYNHFIYHKIWQNYKVWTLQWLIVTKRLFQTEDRSWLDLWVSAARSNLVTILVVTPVCKVRIWAVLSIIYLLFAKYFCFFSFMFYLNTIAIGDELWLKAFWSHCEQFEGVPGKPEDAIVIIIAACVIAVLTTLNMSMLHLAQPLQSKYLSLFTRGARLARAESVRASHPDNDNHWGWVVFIGTQLRRRFANTLC